MKSLAVEIDDLEFCASRHGTSDVIYHRIRETFGLPIQLGEVDEETLIRECQKAGIASVIIERSESDRKTLFWFAPAKPLLSGQ